MGARGRWRWGSIAPGRAGRIGLLAAAIGMDLFLAAFGKYAPPHPTLVVLAAIQCGLAVVLVGFRRWAWLGLGLTVGYAVLAQLVVPHYEPFLLLLVAAYEPFRRWPLRPAVVALLVAAAPLVLAAVRGGLLALVVWSAVLLIPWGVARVLLRAEIADRQRQRAETALALHRERLRLARELHDTVSHAVTAMMWQASGARAVASTSPDTVLTTLGVIESTGQEALRELHRLLGLLHADADPERPAIGAQLDARVGLTDLDHLVQTVRSCGVEVAVEEVGTTTPLDPQVDHVAYRVVQEALTNVIKHRGRGARAAVVLQWDDHGLRLRIPSEGGSGRSAATVSGGMGMDGMTQRVQSIGGRLSAGTPERGRFEVQAWLPRGPGVGTDPP